MLSGGQKARVSLARAVYRAMKLGDQDTIMLLDDPVSALDTHVRQMVFEQLIKGLLKDKTKILATHAVDFMKLADRVIVMEKGRISDVGSYPELEKRCNYIQRISKVHEDNFHDVNEKTGKKQDAKSKKPELAWYQFN
jgi:ABC-type multidrug transport system fused ATPase/permease subunit